MTTEISNIHSFLSRIDVTKDAKEKPSITTYSLFIKCADTLFGTINGYDKSKEAIVDYVNKNTLNKPIGFKIIDIIHNDNVYPYIILQNIEYAIQDSGLSPNTLIKDIKCIITPGSILDPCIRNKADVLYYGFDKKLTEDIFKLIGFNHIKSLYVTKNKQINTIHIDFSYNKNIKVLFDNSANIISGDYNYFSGNTEKNTWFSIQTSNKETIEGCTYILCKELGDTLQALYAKLFINEYKYNNNVCLFTCDLLLTLRCRLLHVPVIVKNYVDNLKDFNYYPNKSNMLTTMKILEIDKVRSQNNSIIYHIDNVIKNGSFYMNNTKLVINDKSKELFESIQKSLKQYIQYVETINTDVIDYMLFCKLVNQYKANHIFTNKDNVYYLYNVSSLYPTLNKDIYEIDIIKNQGKTLFKIINEIYELPIRKYGGEGYSHLEEYLEKNNTYMVQREYREEEENSTTMIQRKILTTCILKYRDASIPELYLITENIYNSIFNYFDYLHHVCYNEYFINDLVDYFDRDNFILNISMNEFMDLFTTHRDRILKAKREEEIQFAKECDELNFGSMTKNEIKLHNRQLTRQMSYLFCGKRLNKTRRVFKFNTCKTIKHIK